MTVSRIIESPAGPLTLLADNDYLVGITFGKKAKGDAPKRHAVLDKAEKQLNEYFKGKRRDFDLPLSPAGTAFQRRVWAGLQTIPYGQTWSYKQLARQIKKPAACRAVGSANGRNPLPIVIPCHRVIAADGKLGGFSSGLGVKRILLRHEGAMVSA